MLCPHITPHTTQIVCPMGPYIRVEYCAYSGGDVCVCLYPIYIYCIPHIDTYTHTTSLLYILCYIYHVCVCINVWEYVVYMNIYGPLCIKGACGWAVYTGHVPIPTDIQCVCGDVDIYIWLDHCVWTTVYHIYT